MPRNNLQCLRYPIRIDFKLIVSFPIFVESIAKQLLLNINNRDHHRRNNRNRTNYRGEYSYIILFALTKSRITLLCQIGLNINNVILP